MQQALHDAVVDFRLLYSFSDPDEVPWGLAYSPDNKHVAYYSNPFYEANVREADQDACFTGFQIDLVVGGWPSVRMGRFSPLVFIIRAVFFGRLSPGNHC